jgi:hypothetical protein
LKSLSTSSVESNGRLHVQLSTKRGGPLGSVLRTRKDPFRYGVKPIRYRVSHLGHFAQCRIRFRITEQRAQSSADQARLARLLARSVPAPITTDSPFVDLDAVVSLVSSEVDLSREFVMA